MFVKCFKMQWSINSFHVDLELIVCCIKLVWIVIKSPQKSLILNRLNDTIIEDQDWIILKLMIIEDNFGAVYNNILGPVVGHNNGMKRSEWDFECEMRRAEFAGETEDWWGDLRDKPTDGPLLEDIGAIEEIFLVAFGWAAISVEQVAVIALFLSPNTISAQKLARGLTGFGVTLFASTVKRLLEHPVVFGVTGVTFGGIADDMAADTAWDLGAGVGENFSLEAKAVCLVWAQCERVVALCAFGCWFASFAISHALWAFIAFVRIQVVADIAFGACEPVCALLAALQKRNTRPTCLSYVKSITDDTREALYFLVASETVVKE